MGILSLGDLASLGSFISGLAVLASLVFLFFQMRQMTEQVRQAERNQRALMNQGMINRVGEIVRWLAEPHMADLTYRVRTREVKFTERELAQLQLRLRHTLLSVQDFHVQHRAGLADQISYDTAMLALRGTLSLPVYRALWALDRQAFAPELRELVDQAVKSTPLAGPEDLAARFEAELAKVMA